MTYLLAGIGYPIGHSLSPVMYNAAFPALGLDARYEAWSTPAEELSAVAERLRSEMVLGLNVTVPHKQAIIPLLDEVDATARAIGAVNCISKVDGRVVGHNTDMYGFVRSLREAGCEPRGLRILVLGVGGSAREIVHGLIEAGAAAVTLAGRSLDRVEILANEVRTAAGATMIEAAGWQDEGFVAAARAADVVVNCTPVGMRHTAAEAESPLPAALLRPGLWVCDLVYNPLETPLLRQVREAGARRVGGLEMLVYQAAESVRWWTGQEAPIDIMRKAALAALAQRE